MSFGSFSNSKNPILEGVNQGQQTTTPRLGFMNAMNRQTLYPDLNKKNEGSFFGMDSLLNGGLGLINGLGSLKYDGDNGIMEGEHELAMGKDDNTKNSLGGSIFSTAGDLFGLYNTLGSGSGGGSFGGYGGLISGGVNGLNSFAESGDYKDGIQGFFGQSKDDSDVMQAIKGTVNGATTGGSFGGPWGALIGGVLGLGSSFLDDI